jgi:hypothetical protein
MQIAANDPGLAHGVSRAAIATMARRSDALYQRLYRKSVPEISRILRKHFGELLLFEDIGRAVGSRANAVWLVLDGEGNELVPLRVGLRRGSLNVGAYRLRISAHCVARILQRTLHHADLKASGPMLLHHLAQASALVEADALRSGDSVQTSSPEGFVLWAPKCREGKSMLIARTWVSAELATERQRHACATWATVVDRKRRRLDARNTNSQARLLRRRRTLVACVGHVLQADRQRADAPHREARIQLDA